MKGTDKVFELTVHKLSCEDDSAKDAVFDCTNEKSLDIIVGKSRDGFITAAVSGILVSVELNKRIGTHNNIKARLKIVQQTSVTDTAPKLNVTLLKNAFLRREVGLNVIVDDKSHAIAEKYYVFGVKPIYNKDGATYYLDLNIYSWDKLMDITKHSKSYARMRLGGDILNGFMESYKKKYESLKLSDCQTSGMRVMVSKPDDSSNGNKNEEPSEIVFPSLEQYNETDYNFLLRNANQCGEFFYFENGTLNLGLTRVMETTSDGTQKEVVTDIDESSYASIESLSDEINDDEVLEAFGEEDAGFKFSANKPNPVYDYNVTSGKPEEPEEDTSDEWGCVYAPWWSRALAHFFQYTTLTDFLIEWGEEELSVKEYRSAMSKNFNTNVRKPYIDSLESKPEGGDQVNSKGKKAYCKYALDDVLFKTMDKAKLNVSDNQYRITFDDGQMNLKLGDIVSCSGIGNGGRFVVVDVHSVFEKEDAVTDAKIVNRMEVTVIPVCNNIPIPLPANAGSKSPVSLRGSSNSFTGSTSNDDPVDAPVFEMRTATVYVSDDPYRRNQVQVTYDDDDTPSAEWVKVLTPFASNDVGISCKLIEGDKVLVCSIKTGTGSVTKTESFVVGSYYDGDNIPPNGQRKFSTIIRSRNGQYIGFEESKSLASFLTGFIPGLNLLKYVIHGCGLMFGHDFLATLSSWSADEDSATYNALGGIEISDNYGFFTIAASSTERNITISSPFGTVGIDAAMGITISAPNGDIKIVGKNVEIEAGNNLTLKSGTNIGSSLLSSITSGNKVNYAKTQGEAILNAISGLFDIPALRFAIELLFKPIAGTLKVHSGRNLLLEANGTETAFKEPSLSWIPDQKSDSEVASRKLSKKVKKFTDSFKQYIKDIQQNYTDMVYKRGEIINQIKFNCICSDGNEVTDDVVNTKIKAWLDKANWVPDDFTTVFSITKNLTEDEKLRTRNTICSEISLFLNKSAEFWDIDKCKRFTPDDTLFNRAKNIRRPRTANDISDEVKYFISNESLVMKTKLFYAEEEQKKQLRLGVLDIIKSSFKYTLDNEDNVKDDQNWDSVIASVEPKITIYTALYGMRNVLVDALNNAIPLQSLNTYCWGKDNKGKIMMSQNAGSTLSINGTTIQEDVADSDYESIKKEMRNATLV